MPLEDYLLPGEEIRFRSAKTISYGEKQYELIVTNKRVILYARRGLLLKTDDVVTVKLDEIQGIKYKERGIIGRKGILEIHGKTLLQLEGNPAEMKTLYQQVLQFI